MQIVADVHMPLLLVPDHNSGACVRIGEGSTARHGVVHLSDPLLTPSLFLSFFCKKKKNYTSFCGCSLMVPSVFLPVSAVSGVGISCLPFGFFVELVAVSYETWLQRKSNSSKYFLLLRR